MQFFSSENTSEYSNQFMYNPVMVPRIYFLKGQTECGFLEQRYLS